MGLTSEDRPQDDCTASEVECAQREGTREAEVPEQRLESLVHYVRSLEVPKSPHRFADAPLGSSLFDSSGCASCHRRSLPIDSPAQSATGASHGRSSGVAIKQSIAAYTDLQLHDMGPDMADADAAGRTVPTTWRTAPLWALGSRIGSDGKGSLLHDGRARSVEEAILWHGGEAARSRRRFVDLGPRSRQALLHYLATL
jgi:CxxC motif-containing protein (DUF1111 family)